MQVPSWRRLREEVRDTASRIGRAAESRLSTRVVFQRARFLPLAGLCLVSMGAWAVPARAEDPTLEDQKRDLANVEQRVRDMEKDLVLHRGRRKDLLVELERRERDIGDLARAGHQLAAMITEQEAALGKLHAQLVEERKILDREHTILGSLLRSAYVMGPGDRLRMLLDQEDASRSSRIMAYYGILNQYRVERIQAVARRAHRLDELAREAETERARLSALAQRQEQTRTRLTAAQDERARLLASLEQTIATRAESVGELREQAQELRLLLEQLERQAQALPEAELSQQSLKQLHGNLPWPLADVRLLSHYDSLKGDGAQRWDGVILKAEEGTEVRAVQPGRVVYADWLRGFGQLIIIEHDDDYMTLYGQNQALLAEPGDWVDAGDTIALSGNSGGGASSGLYFAIRHRGRPLNPEQWCRREPEGKHNSSAASLPRVERIVLSPLQPRRSPGSPGLPVAFVVSRSPIHSPVIPL
jgi:septal ring factor EnvC (AmiA/AmiB activator)